MSKQTNVVSKRQPKKVRPHGWSLAFVIIYVILLIVAVVAAVILFTPLYNMIIDAAGIDVDNTFLGAIDYVESHFAAGYGIHFPLYISSDQATSPFYSMWVMIFLYAIMCLIALFFISLPLFAMGRVRLKRKCGKVHRYIIAVINLLIVLFISFTVLVLPWKEEMSQYFSWVDRMYDWIRANLFAEGKVFAVLSQDFNGNISNDYLTAVTWTYIATIVVSIILHIITLAGGNKKKKADKVPYYEREYNPIPEEEETILPAPTPIENAPRPAAVTTQNQQPTTQVQQQPAPAQISTPVFITQPIGFKPAKPVEEAKPEPAPEPEAKTEAVSEPEPEPKPEPRPEFHSEPPRPPMPPRPDLPHLHMPPMPPKPVEKIVPELEVKPTATEIAILNALEPMTLNPINSLPGLYDTDVDAILNALEPKNLSAVEHTPTDAHEDENARAILASLGSTYKEVKVLPGITETGEAPWDETVSATPEKEEKEEIKEEQPSVAEESSATEVREEKVTEETTTEATEAEAHEEKPTEEASATETETTTSETQEEKSAEGTTSAEAQTETQTAEEAQEAQVAEERRTAEILESLDSENTKVEELPGVNEESPWEEEKEEEKVEEERVKETAETSEPVQPVQEEEDAETIKATEIVSEVIEDVTAEAQPEAINEPIIEEIPEEASSDERITSTTASTIAINQLSSEDTTYNTIEQEEAEPTDGESRYEERVTRTETDHETILSKRQAPVVETVVIERAPSTTVEETSSQETTEKAEAPVVQETTAPTEEPAQEPVIDEEAIARKRIVPVAPMAHEEEKVEVQEEEKRLSAVSGPLHAIRQGARKDIKPVEARRVKFDLQQYRVRTYEGDLTPEEAFSRGLTKVQATVNPVFINQSQNTGFLSQKREDEIRRSGYTNVTTAKIVKPTRPISDNSKAPKKATSIRDLVRQKKEEKKTEEPASTAESADTTTTTDADASEKSE